MTVVEVSRGMLHVEYYHSTKPLFVSIKFNGDHATACEDEVKSDHPPFWGYFHI